MIWLALALASAAPNQAAASPAPAPATATATATATAPATVAPDEETLIAGAIAALRPQIPAPEAVQFRRVYLRRHGERASLCGQAFFDDPRAARGWTQFVAIEMRGTVTVFLGSGDLIDARRACAPTNGAWDYGRDFSARFAAELAVTR